MFNIFINFKTYPQGSGKKAVELAGICKAVGGESGLKIIPIVQATDLRAVKEATGEQVWVQHLDPEPQGKFTGWTNLETVIEAGASGTLLNHSEHQIPPGTIKQVLSAVVSRSKANNRFQTMICCKTLGQMERLIKLKPDFLGYEISELIGGKISITENTPKSISHGVKICGEIPLIIGAGVNKAEDLFKARELGAAGVLISSAVVLAENQKEKLTELVKLVK